MIYKLGLMDYVFLDPVGSLVSTLLVVGWLVVTLIQNLFILSVVVL